MNKKILILMLSDKYKGCCVAGLDLETNQFVRLVDNAHPERNGIAWSKLVSVTGKRISVLDVVQVNHIKYAPTAIHPENYTITEDSVFRINGAYDTNELLNIMDCCPQFDKRAILMNQEHVLYDLVSASHSLELIFFENGILYGVHNMHGVLKTKFDFTYNNIRYTNFSVTDPNKYVREGQEIRIQVGIIAVSIPDDEWSREHGFYKFIAAIYM